jgi:hypothetical protein
MKRGAFNAVGNLDPVDIAMSYMLGGWGSIPG